MARLWNTRQSEHVGVYAATQRATNNVSKIAVIISNIEDRLEFHYLLDPLLPGKIPIIGNPQLLIIHLLRDVR